MARGGKYRTNKEHRKNKNHTSHTLATVVKTAHKIFKKKQ